MGYELFRSADCERDLEFIFDHLVEAYQNFGDPIELALTRAEERVRGIEDALLSLSNAPHQGTLRPELGSDIRNVTKDRAIIYFQITETPKRVLVLAIFFGGQDHRRHMLKRLLEP